MRRVQFWAEVATVVGFFVALVSLLLQTMEVRKGVDSVQQRVQRVEEQTLRQLLQITYPVNNSVVGQQELVQGMTPYTERNNYLLVTPIQMGGDWLQDGPAKISPGGLWSARVTIGRAADKGERFVIRVMVTNSKLSAGPLANIPDDAVFSAPVTVVRERNKEQ